MDKSIINSLTNAEIEPKNIRIRMRQNSKSIVIQQDIYDRIAEGR